MNCRQSAAFGQWIEKFHGGVFHEQGKPTLFGFVGEVCDEVTVTGIGFSTNELQAGQARDRFTACAGFLKQVIELADLHTAVVDEVV